MTTVIVSGAVANKHRHGGSVWTRLSWAESLRRLGFEVVFVEEPADAAAVDAQGRPTRAESANADVFERVMAEFGFRDNCALLSQDGGSLRGLPAEEVQERFARAGLLVNISGHCAAPSLGLPGCRAYVDLDPGYTQIWHQEGHEMGLGGHDLYFTVGANLGTTAAHCPPAAWAGGRSASRWYSSAGRWPMRRSPATRRSAAGAAHTAR